MSPNIHSKVSKTLDNLIKRDLIDSYELIPTDTHLLKIKLQNDKVELTYSYLGLIDMEERELYQLFKNDIQNVIEENILDEVQKIIR